jgi:hypothetical protein
MVHSFLSFFRSPWSRQIWEGEKFNKKRAPCKVKEISLISQGARN